MFIERSSARVRMVRTLFVLLGLMPCAGLCGWAALRHSASHRHAIERRCEQVIGLPVRIGRVEHVRPDAIRLHDCTVATATGGTLAAAASVDVESTSTEVRVRVGRLACPPQLARAIAALVQQWLDQPARFSQDCVVELGELSWQEPPSTKEPDSRGHDSRGHDSKGHEAAGPSRADAVRPAGLRLECVAAADGGRAVRISGGGAGAGSATDELRVLATVVDAVGDRVGPAAVRLDVNGAVARPVPVAVVEACLGCEPGGLAFDPDALVSGRFEAIREGGRWSGTAQGIVERVDLAAASAGLPHRASGDATLAIERVDWVRDRIAACDCRFTATRGAVDQRILDLLVSALGCRPGPAYGTAAGGASREFDRIACRLRVGPAGVDVRADQSAGAAIAVVRGAAILDEPVAAVPLERLAWLLSPPSAVAVPATPASRWLMGTFSEDVLSGAERVRDRETPRKPAEQAGRPARRSDF